jgi:protein involved in polysaccharide export with SLBB domain
VEVHRKQALLGLLDLALGDAPLEPGDSIHVPKRSDVGYVYVVGGVMKPNRYALRPGMVLLEALEGAGGLRPEIRNQKAVLVRTENGKTVRRTFDVASLRARTTLDVLLRAGDLIDVPEPIR